MVIVLLVITEGAFTALFGLSGFPSRAVAVVGCFCGELRPWPISRPRELPGEVHSTNYTSAQLRKCLFCERVCVCVCVCVCV